MTHTPGPWVIGGQHVPHHPLAILHESGVRATCVAAICDQGVSDHNIAEMEANAQLLVAAPKMLKALQAILAEVSGEYDGWAKDAVSVLSIREIAQAAIAAATGEQKGANK